MKLVIYYYDDNFVPEVVECDSFTIDRSGNFEPLLRLFDADEKEIRSMSLTIGNFHVCGMENKNGSD